MSQSSQKKIMSWIIGILVFVVLNYVSEQIASYYGLSTSFYFEGFEYGEYVEKDKSTSLGWFLIVMEIFVASRIGMAIYFKNFKEGVGEHTNLLLTTLVVCLGVYAFIDTIIWEFFERELRRYFAPIVYNILNLGLLAGISYIGFISYHQVKYKRDRYQLDNYIFEKIHSNDGDHFLEKKEGIFFLGYDNGKDLRMWKFEIPNSVNEQILADTFLTKTGRGVGRFEFFKWLENEGINLHEHNWY